MTPSEDLERLIRFDPLFVRLCFLLILPLYFFFCERFAPGRSGER